MKSSCQSSKRTNKDVEATPVSRLRRNSMNERLNDISAGDAPFMRPASGRLVCALSACDGVIMLLRDGVKMEASYD